MKASAAPWFHPPDACVKPGQRVLVIGGGVAGTTVANALARRGVRVLLLERTHLAAGPSGNPAAVILPSESAAPDLQSRFYKAAFDEALHQINRLQGDGRNFAWYASGMVRLATTPRLKRIHGILKEKGSNGWTEAVDVERCHQLTGLDLGQPGLYFPRAGYLDPAALCHGLVTYERIQVQTDKEVVRLHRQDQIWHAFDAMDRCLGRGAAVVIANGYNAVSLVPESHLPLQSQRGQLAEVDERLIKTMPKLPISYGGTAVPLPGKLMVGATWDGEKRHLDCDRADQDRLLAEAGRWLPIFKPGVAIPLKGRAAFRTQSPDHLPLIGPLPQAEGYAAAYGDLHHGKTKADYPPAPLIPGMFGILGLGGRGLTSCFLAAEMVAGEMVGEAPLLERDLIHALHPGRFLIRWLKKRPEMREASP